MKKRSLRLLSVLLCAAMLTIPAAAAEGTPAQPDATPVPISAPVDKTAPLAPRLLRGTVTHETKSLLLKSFGEQTVPEETVIHIGEETLILNAATGEPVTLDSIVNGETIYTYVSPAMTLSLPPQTTALLILTKVPANHAAEHVMPVFYQVMAVEGVSEKEIQIDTDRGEKLTVTSAAAVTPYLTKNIVTFRDLTPGARFLAWSDTAGVINRVIIFPGNGLPYTDVDKDYWARDAIAYVSDRGLMQGESDLTFRPTEAMTRAEVVVALYRIAGSPAIIQSVPGFTDIQEGGAYISALTWAVGNKIVSGYGDNTFRPDAPVTREQMATYIYRWEQHQGGGFKDAWSFLMDYTDIKDVGQYAYEAVAWCTMNKILSGRADGTLAPDETVTRAAAAVMLQRYLTK